MTKLHTTCQPNIYYTSLDELPTKIQNKIYEGTLIYERTDLFENHHYYVEFKEVINDRTFSIDVTIADGRLEDIDQLDLRLMAEDILGDDAGHLTVYLTEL